MNILIKQFAKPLNSRSAPFPTSAAKRVRAKSSGYTTHKLVAPAAPPEAKFPENYVSLTEKTMSDQQFNQRKIRTKLTEEKFPKFSLFIDAADEKFPVSIFESEIQSLRRKISNDVGQISAP